MTQINVNVLNLASNALSQLRYGSSIDSKNINNADNSNYVRSLAVSEIDDAGMMKVSAKRMSNYFLTSSLNQSASDYEYAKSRQSTAESVDNIVTGVVPNSDGKSTNPISQALSDIMKSVNAIASDDTYSSRNTFIARVGGLLSVVGGVQDNLNTSRTSLDMEISNDVSDLNSLAEKLSRLNKRMVTNPNGDGLVLQRDTLISEMSNLAKVDVSKHENGTVDVRVGAGYTLVGGRHAYKVNVGDNKYGDSREITISGDIVRSDSIGGSIGGNIAATGDIVRRSQSHIAKVVVGYMGEMNRVNQSGYLKDGSKGGEMFEIPAVNSVASNENTGNGSITVTLDINKISELQTPLIVTRSAGGYEVKLQGSDKVVNLPSLPSSVFGFKVDSTGSMNIGDSFKIDPLPEMLSAMKLVAKEGGIATATKLPVSAGDESNIQNFANVSDMRIFNNSGDTVVNELSNTFVRIGNAAVSSKQDVDSTKAINKDARGRWDNLSGVNTQEEEMDIVRIQQVYQSVTKIISASKQMFDSLISAV